MTGENQMEFDSIFHGLKRKKYISRLPRETIALIEEYAVFYGVEQDQVVNTAIGQFLAADAEFLEYMRHKHNK